MKLSTLDVSDLSTISLALQGWAIRCDNEERRMTVFAADHSQTQETIEKAKRNAAASRKLAAEARATLAKLES